MSGPLLSVICPTIGRPALARTLASVREQAPASEVEIIVVGDSHGGNGTLRHVPDVCRDYQADYHEYDGGLHAWGHPQRIYGTAVATAPWLWWLQDDDIATPSAIAAIRASIAAGDRVPRLFRIHGWQVGTVWTVRGRLAHREIDADCIVAPNDPARLGRWAPAYDGDWTFISETAEAYGGPGAVRWESAVIAIGRPS